MSSALTSSSELSPSSSPSSSSSTSDFTSTSGSVNLASFPSKPSSRSSRADIALLCYKSGSSGKSVSLNDSMDVLCPICSTRGSTVLVLRSKSSWSLFFLAENTFPGRSLTTSISLPFPTAILKQSPFSFGVSIFLRVIAAFRILQSLIRPSQSRQRGNRSSCAPYIAVNRQLQLVAAQLSGAPKLNLPHSWSPTARCLVD